MTYAVTAAQQSHFLTPFSRLHPIRFAFTGATPVQMRFSVLHINHFSVEPLGISSMTGQLFDGSSRATFRNLFLNLSPIYAYMHHQIQIMSHARQQFV